jgi:nucleotide-binding universal stress UspA family protein
MFKNILVPTDGSEPARHAAKQAVALAKKTGSSITAFYVAPPYTFNLYEDYMPPDFVRPEEYEERVRRVAEQRLDTIRKLAAEAGVPFDSHYTKNDFPAEAIVQAAETYGCDSIVMGSHGRSGIKKIVLGSQTQKVLALANLPVIVVR